MATIRTRKIRRGRKPGSLSFRSEPKELPFFSNSACSSFFMPSGANDNAGRSITRHYAHCQGVNIEGHTDSNYTDSFSSDGRPKAAKNCDECADEDCVTVNGNVVSVFTASPRVTLPAVPEGLSTCEQSAVGRFIATTLNAHEQEHVRAFRTYNGRIRTPFRYKGCREGFDSHIIQLHQRLEIARRSRADQASGELDANGRNNFTITCNCPD